MMRHGLQRYIWCGRSRIGYHWEPLLTTGIGQLVLHQLLYEFLYILITLFVIVYMHVVYRLKVENFRLSSYPPVQRYSSCSSSTTTSDMYEGLIYKLLRLLDNVVQIILKSLQHIFLYI